MNLRFKLGRSVYLAALLCLAHGALLAALPQLALPVWSRLALVVVVLCSLAYFLWHDAWLAAPSSCTELAIDGGVITLVLRNGKCLAGRVSNGSLVTPWLTVLNVSLPHRCKGRSVLVLPDSMAKDAFRQLRVWLKWGGQDAG